MTAVRCPADFEHKITNYCVCERQSSTGAGSVVVVNDEGDTLGLMTAR